MARVYQLGQQEEAIEKGLIQSFQSAHMNFLLGSGASRPSIGIAGDVEQEINALFASNDDAGARKKLYTLLSSIQLTTNRLLTNALSDDDGTTLKEYTRLVRLAHQILGERRSTILPKQAAFFTTNYDMFIDVAARDSEISGFTNGFAQATTVDGPLEYSTQRFFQLTYDTGNLYDYRVEVPTINLIKLHGCLSWSRTGDKIVRQLGQREPLDNDDNEAKVLAFLNQYAVILPQASKFNTTVLDKTYYELLRLYANELDKENVLLVAFGFSFNDEHILHITLRALKNPTLRVVIFAYDSASRTSYVEKFAAHNNVIIIAPDDNGSIDFARMNDIIEKSSPKPRGWE